MRVYPNTQAERETASQFSQQGNTAEAGSWEAAEVGSGEVADRFFNEGADKLITQEVTQVVALNFAGVPCSSNGKGILEFGRRRA